MNFEMENTQVLKSFLEQADTPPPRTGEMAKCFKRRSNVNLEKSMQLLNEAVSPALNQSSRTPRTSFRRSVYTPDLSEALRYTPGKKSQVAASDISDALRFTPGKKSQSMYPEATFTDSPQGYTSFNVTGVTKMDLEPTMTMANMTYHQVEDPGKKASTQMFEAFSDALKRNPAPHQVMSLLQEYVSSCEDRVAVLRKVERSAIRNKSKFDKAAGVEDSLFLEKTVWSLLHCLYKDRLETEERDQVEEEEEMESSHKNVIWALSEKNIVDRLYEKDALVRQSQLVVDWLETCASLDDVMKKSKFFIEQPIAWENTLHNLQKQKGNYKTVMSRCITEMDPDAPCRQKLSLDDLDQEDEKIFLRDLFQCVRAGKLDKAQELCQAYGQIWRAATLEGWRLHHDPNYSNDTVVNLGDVSAVEGNAHRDVWKATCWALAGEYHLDLYERATYAALSGNLHSILPVCESWMDYVWAYFKVMVDNRVEEEVRLHRIVDRRLEILPEGYSSTELSPEHIFKEIAASINEKVRLLSENIYHQIHKFVILGDVPGLIEVIYNCLQTNRDSVTSNSLRMFAHIVLFFKSIGQICKEELCEAILRAFVDDLIKNKHRDIVAHYVSTLNSAQQVECYARFLEDIEDQDERQELLQRAEDEGLDVASIAKTVVERIRSRESEAVHFPENSLVSDLAISEEDTAKISAIDWLVFDETHRPEALKQANAIMRAFIAVKKHTAARHAFEKLPSDTIDVIFKLWRLKTGDGELPPSDSNAIREYLCMKAYLDAVESFNDWFNLFHKGQPSPPEAMNGGASFTDRVAHEHKLKQYNTERERWKHNLLGQTKTTRDRIYNVLLFADGGWLQDSCEDPEASESRQHQLVQLRRLHLPGLCLNLHTVLHASELYAEAVQIADVVASELHQLYKNFDKEAMQHLLVQISRSSICLLDENKDPLGYDMV